MEFGIEGSAILNKFDYVFEQWQDSYGNITPRLMVKNNMNGYKAGIFGVEHLQLTDKLKFILGARADYFDLTNAFNISPRASASYDIDDKTTASASAGIFYQDIPTYIISKTKSSKNLKLQNRSIIF